MDSLSTLQPGPKVDGKIRVRVSRCWRHVSRSGELMGVSFIVVDHHASRMHGWIRTALTDRFEHQFVEGRVIDIQNFVVRPYRELESNICFRSDKHMMLTGITAIVPVEEVVPNFPMHVFFCNPLNLIQDHGDQERYLIGKIPSFETVDQLR
ncbi:hypothetical protein ACET3Z_021342 [Daucus carota]